MFCPNCGTENEEAATTCKKCGFNLKGAAAPKFKGTMLMMNAPAAPRAGAPAAPRAGPPAPAERGAPAAAAARRPAASAAQRARCWAWRRLRSAALSPGRYPGGPPPAPPHGAPTPARVTRGPGPPPGARGPSGASTRSAGPGREPDRCGSKLRPASGRGRSTVSLRPAGRWPGRLRRHGARSASWWLRASRPAAGLRSPPPGVRSSTAVRSAAHGGPTPRTVKPGAHPPGGHPGGLRSAAGLAAAAGLCRKAAATAGRSRPMATVSTSRRLRHGYGASAATAAHSPPRWRLWRSRPPGHGAAAAVTAAAASRRLPGYGAPSGFGGAPAGGYGMPGRRVYSSPGARGPIGQTRNPVMVLVLGMHLLRLRSWSRSGHVERAQGVPRQGRSEPHLVLRPHPRLVRIWSCRRRSWKPSTWPACRTPRSRSPILYLLLGICFLPDDLNEIWQAAGGGATAVVNLPA